MSTSLIPNEIIESKIFIIRSKKVMLDKDLANLYGVTTSNLNKAVKRNFDRFPSDFMFQLTKEEHGALRFHFGILEKGKHSKYLPYAFTEQGVAMLSSVLKSKRAVKVNIQIMRTFSRIREILITHEDLKRKIDDIIRKQNIKFEDYDSKINDIFEIINQLIATEEKPKKKYGFLADRD